MPRSDATASATAGTTPVAGIGTGVIPGTCTSTSRTDASVPESLGSEDTLELRLPDNHSERLEVGRRANVAPPPDRLEGAVRPATVPSASDDLLDQVAEWGPTTTPVGVFHLVPVRIERDLSVVSRWMNDSAVARFWELAGPESVTADHLAAQLSGEGRSVPCLGMLEGTPMSYWEIYRADLDPLACHYPARPHDTGIHLLIGDVADRGRRLGSALLRAVADLVLAKRFLCARVVAEPDLRNIPSIAAFLSAGFGFATEIDLPAKQAALMIRDRSLRHLL
ncbi:GNAT family N-acetyltransferase [Streptomyces sp. AC555_RSS877]|uniref:GNAT family N-acetyltransferase n=1 Tax=Streptomyces sp. AC555_RSS877 TaxID=2823688 RepID=UPI001C25E1C4|nr:GNAT family N-acetyltransferase [Streptomyces sp. AC555_RSS877]